MLFEVAAAYGGARRTFAGVSEFTAPEGVVIVPVCVACARGSACMTHTVRGSVG
jgi:hypothetical protein